MAVEVYERAAGLSGVDMNGYPQLTKLELVIDYMNGEVEDREEFFSFIEALHNWHIRLRNERG